MDIQHQIRFDGGFIPTGPYYFQNGKHAGKCMDKMMFDDSSFLMYYLSICRREASGIYRNQSHRHLEWLITRGEDRVPQMICSHCKKNIVTCFSVRYSSHNYEPSISLSYVYCDECKDRFTHRAFGNIEIFPFKWSILQKFSDRYGRGSKIYIKEIIKIYREIFVLPARLTNEMAFEFFRSNRQVPDNIYH